VELLQLRVAVGHDPLTDLRLDLDEVNLQVTAAAYSKIVLSNFLGLLEGSAKLYWFVVLLLEDLSNLRKATVPKRIVFFISRVFVVGLFAIEDQLGLFNFKVNRWLDWLSCEVIGEASIIICFKCSVRWLRSLILRRLHLIVRLFDQKLYWLLAIVKDYLCGGLAHGLLTRAVSKIGLKEEVFFLRLYVQVTIHEEIILI
jgi:hypothetical protein